MQNRAIIRDVHTRHKALLASLTTAHDCHTHYYATVL